MKLAQQGHLYVPPTSPTFSNGLKPVIGYVRVSTWREEKISNEIQKDAINAACARRGRYVAKWIEDLDESGRHFKRKIMQGIELIEADDNPINEIWVWKFSRFGRNRHGVAINLFRIEDVGGELLSATEDVDPSTATGEFTRDMLFAVANFESRRTGEQWKETHDLRRALGLPATGRKRFGYRWHPRRLPDGEGGWTLQDEWYQLMEDQAELIHESYDHYRGGKTGFIKVAHRWNDLGFLNMWGHPWQDQAVKSYLDSGFAAGLLRSHKTDVRCPKKGLCRNMDHWQFLPAEHDVIETSGEWENYWDRRQTRRNTPRRSLEPAYPLSGLMKCGMCRLNGWNAYAENASSHGVTGKAYRCGPTTRGHLPKHETVWILRSLVEAEVHKWLLDVRDEIDAIVAGRIVVPVPQIDQGIDKTRKRLKDEIIKLSKALDRATEGNVMGRIPNDSYERTRDKIVKDRDAAQAKLDELPAEDAVSPSPVPFRETVVGLVEEWDTISVASKRVALAEIIRRVEIGPNKKVTVVPVWAPKGKPVRDFKLSAKTAKPRPSKIVRELKSA